MIAIALLLTQISVAIPQDVRNVQVDVPPDGNNITRQLQQAVEIADRLGSPEVVIPPGKWTVSKTIDVNPSRRFRNITIRGEGGGIPYADNNGTEVRALFDKGAVFAFQSVRGACLKNLRIVGPTKYPRDKNDAEAWEIYHAEKNYQLSGLAVDPWTGEPPEGEHLESAKWVRSASSMVYAENCQFRFLGCGIIIHPAGGSAADRQGDYLKVRDCNFQWCRFGASINGSQTRGNVFEGCHFWDCYAGIVGGFHGVERCGPIQAVGGSFDRVHYCVKTTNTGFANSVIIERNEGEQIGCIADCRKGNGVARLLIAGNNFKLRAFEELPIPATVHADGCSTSIRENVIRLYQNSKVPTAIFRLGGGVNAIRDNLFRQVAPNTQPTFIVLSSMYPDATWEPRIDNNYRHDWITTLWPEASGRWPILRSAYQDGDNWTGTISSDTQYKWQPGQLVASVHPNDEQIALFRVVDVNASESKATIKPLRELDNAKPVIESTNRYVYQIDRK